MCPLCILICGFSVHYMWILGALICEYWGVGVLIRGNWVSLYSSYGHALIFGTHLIYEKLENYPFPHIRACPYMRVNTVDMKDWLIDLIVWSCQAAYNLRKNIQKKYGSEKNDIYSFLATAFEYSSFLARQNCDYQFLMMEIVWVLVSYKRVSYIKKSVLLYLLLKIIRKSVWIWLN